MEGSVAKSWMMPWGSLGSLANLHDAMEFVAPLAQAKGGKGPKGTTPKMMKTTKMAVQGNPKPAPIKKMAMKAKSKVAKKKAHKTIQGTATPNGESLTPPSLMVVPPETTIHLFDSSHWGSCKMEVYAHKSYIRRRDEGKWRSIIGSCTNNHGAVVRALVPFVIQGLSIEELYKVRNSLDL